MFSAITASGHRKGSSEPPALLLTLVRTRVARLGGNLMANVVYFRLGRSVKPGGEPGAELVEWASGGWKLKRDEQANPIVLGLEQLTDKPGFVSVTPYIDPVAMGSSYSPQYVAFFR